jgi:hypothetical protein
MAAKPSRKITTKQKPSGVFTGRYNAKFTAMSALPPKADIAKHRRDVCFVPKADVHSKTSSAVAQEHWRVVRSDVAKRWRGNSCHLALHRLD